MSGAMTAGTMATVATGMQVAGMVTQAQAARDQSKAAKKGYEYQAVVNRNNAMVAEWQAQDALQRGARTEQQQQLKTAQLKGSQRARAAANGVAIDEGSPLAILQDTDYMGDMDARTIRDNTAKEASGFRSQSANYSNDAQLLQGRADAESPNRAMFNSLLGSAGSVSDSWYRRSQTTSAPKKG